MGLGTERHDMMSQAHRAVARLRQPVVRVAREKRGETFTASTTNPAGLGRNEFLGGTWRSIPTDRSASANTSNRRTVRASRSRRTRHGWASRTCSDCRMRRNRKASRRSPTCEDGVFKVKDNVYRMYEHRSPRTRLGADVDASEEAVVGRQDDRRPGGRRRAHRLQHASRRFEFYAKTPEGVAEHAVPRYVPGHVLEDDQGDEAN